MKIEDNKYYGKARANEVMINLRENLIREKMK